MASFIFGNLSTISANAKKKWHYFWLSKLSKLVKPIFGSSFNYKLEYELWTIRISSIYSKATIALQYLQTLITQLTLKWPFIIIQPGIFNMFAILSLQSHHCIAIFANNNYRIYIEKKILAFFLKGSLTCVTIATLGLYRYMLDFLKIRLCFFFCETIWKLHLGAHIKYRLYRYI